MKWNFGKAPCFHHSTSLLFPQFALSAHFSDVSRAFAKFLLVGFISNAPALLSFSLHRTPRSADICCYALPPNPSIPRAKRRSFGPRTNSKIPRQGQEAGEVVIQRGGSRGVLYNSAKGFFNIHKNFSRTTSVTSVSSTYPPASHTTVYTSVFPGAFNFSSYRSTFYPSSSPNAMHLYSSSVTEETVFAGDSLLTINTFDSTVTVDDYVNEHIKLSDEQGKEDAFYVVNLGDVVQKLHLWRDKLPRVEPFYAVKCNDDPAVLQTLAALGTGFDCASKAEITKVLSLGVEPDRIIYAHPCKTASHIRFAAETNVRMTTFDNEPELHKIKQLHPTAKLVLRIRADDPKAICNLGIKFGAKVPEAKRLLGVAKGLGLDVIGVSFHVGSGCTNADAYGKAISWAAEVFDHAREIGMNLTMLDIGGGFPGQRGAPITFEEIVDEVSPALEKYFPAESGIRIIAEPGRFFVASAFTLVVNIVAKRIIDAEQLAQDQDGPKFMYYVNDGVYGSFNCLMYDHATVDVKVPPFYVPSELHRASIWGPTCDGIDCILKKAWMPEMDIGQWLIFEDMGAYTCAASSTFNGFARPYFVYIAPAALYDTVRDPSRHSAIAMPRTTSQSTDEGFDSMEDQARKAEDEVVASNSSSDNDEEEDAEEAMSCAAQEAMTCYEIPALPEVELIFTTAE
ncbi:Ornithine decarboxylase [Hypsibius exemplaris]|uniref:ornithine decarboxylase n=1 Tax=Hypsibius exemplaris TaxID=2072580 RepID=A0A1W0WD80_HYPEX|nr:Ornithine decarboxylase [Hypsibius exemplaris]